MLMRSLCFVIALLFASSNALAENWVKIGNNSTGSTFHFDRDTLKSQGTSFRVWIMIDHSKDKTFTERKSKDLLLFDCENETVTMLASYTFRADGLMIRGTTLEESKQKQEPVIPGSIGATVFDAVCKT